MITIPTVFVLGAGASRHFQFPVGVELAQVVKNVIPTTRNGGIFSVSAGVGGGTMFRFEGPKERGITNKAIVVTTTGWDLSAGFSSDGPGYWHRVGD